MTRRSNGFTVIELAITLVVAGVLLTISMPAFQSAASAMSVRSAKTMYATLQQRARARSIELGETVLFFVDTQGDSAWILAPSQGVSDVTRFRAQMNIDLRATPGTYMMCMTPRGYADHNCGSAGGLITATTSSPIKLEFWQNADSTSLLVLPMGQLVGL